MTRPDVHGCPHCGASVRAAWSWCGCGHFLGLDPLPPSEKPWTDILCTPIVEEAERRQMLADVEKNREAHRR